MSCFTSCAFLTRWFLILWPALMQDSSLKLLRLSPSQPSIISNYFKCFQMRVRMTLNCLYQRKCPILPATFAVTFSMALIQQAMACFSSFIAKSIQLQLTVQNSRIIIIPVRNTPESNTLIRGRQTDLLVCFYPIIIMYNKTEEESDYLESLFIKPFCERYCEETTPSKNGRLNTSQDEYKPTKRQTYHIYHAVPEQDASILRKNSAIGNRYKLSQKDQEMKSNLTPYLSRKNQQKGFAKQIRKQLIQKNRQLPHSLESTQPNWLIIREMNSKLGDIKEQPLKTVQTYKEMTLNEAFQQSRQEEAKRDSEAVQDSKNIKTMMSYYKNKRLIKHMTKMNDNINLNNSEYQQSINLRVQNTSAIKNKQIQQRDSDNAKTMISTKRKSYIRQRVVKTQQSVNPFSQQVKSRLIRVMTSNSSSMSSFHLKDFLKSSKIDMRYKQQQHRPKTEVRLKRSQHISPSKPYNIINSSKCNEVCAWQNLSQKLQGDSMLLI